jgi:hypothetical protein
VRDARILAPLGTAPRWNRIDPVETAVLDDGSRFEVPVGIDADGSALHNARRMNSVRSTGT